MLLLLIIFIIVAVAVIPIDIAFLILITVWLQSFAFLYCIKGNIWMQANEKKKMEIVWLQNELIEFE